MVTHPDSNHEQRCLTSVIPLELINSTCYAVPAWLTFARYDDFFFFFRKSVRNLYRPFFELSSTCPTFTELLTFISPTGNGYITTDVLREIISELDPNLDYEELNEMIEEIDSDGSGTIDFDGESIE